MSPILPFYKGLPRFEIDIWLSSNTLWSHGMKIILRISDVGQLHIDASDIMRDTLKLLPNVQNMPRARI